MEDGAAELLRLAALSRSDRIHFHASQCNGGPARSEQITDFRVIGPGVTGLFHRHGFRQVARLVDIGAHEDGG
ncbi:MAG: hypothetical protein WCE42_37610, partial [Rhizobium ruizarguesonis]